MISSSRLAELQHAPPAWKFCAVQSQERFDRENAQRANDRRFFDCRKWKTTARPRKTLPGSPDQGQKNKRVREEPSRDTRKDREGAEVLRGSVHGVARVLQAAQLHLRLQEAVLLPGSGLANKWVFERPSKTDLETCRKYRELKRKLSERALTQRKARAREEPSPGPPASETDARPPGHQPRGGAPARPRLSRGQECPT